MVKINGSKNYLNVTGSCQQFCMWWCHSMSIRYWGYKWFFSRVEKKTLVHFNLH